MSDSQFKPHVTLACVVQAENKFLMVEELINGSPTLNQPAGHLEADETLFEGAQRELWEETGIQAAPQSLLQIYQWIARDGTPFIRFTFAIDLPEMLATHPHDSDIECCHWLSAEEILNAANLRSPLVRESLLRYQQPERYPLSIIESYNWTKKRLS
ncbi:NUDIX hydrolase [Pragia fontium]|uniref:Phosphatase NudJ n=1 Tax=Pragia fontium TaxID=82985 RepID=A0ABQ5LEA6_9GAMM|nr:NUDIX hydrolase [Pragia fontium]GKX61950.1 phosphatase NudJ [Pragia fontium]VEJ55036.1 Phosphatase nudJ [Pragia fontium]